jgi:hypothetical protein
MSTAETTSPDPSVQKMVSFLLRKGLTHVQISEGLGGHVSSRTIYRWSKDESTPQNASNVKLLTEFYRSKGGR